MKTALLLSLVSFMAFAGTGADLLLQSVDKDAKSLNTEPAKKAEIEKPKVTEKSLADLAEGVKLNDPFTMQLFSVWQSEKNLPFEVNQWVMRILKGDLAGASHLWSALQLKFPASFKNAAQSAHVYVLWKLGLNQTFWDAWVALLDRKEFMDSKFAFALEQTIQPGFENWFLTNMPSVSPEQQVVFDKINKERSPMYLLVQAHGGLRKGLSRAKLLDSLPASHPYKVALSRTVALAYAKQPNLSEAAKILKRHLEPAIEASKNPRLLAQHYLEVARLLYQTGNLEAAQSYYEKIPNSVPEFLNAREELTWIWLRQTNIGNLRGEIATLSSPIFNGVFAPEVPLVRAISNLKLCYYDAVEKAMQNFMVQYVPWAKKIDDGIQLQDSVAPEHKDEYTLKAEIALAHLKKEYDRLNKISDESIQAVLPAVGPQSHWVKAQDVLLKTIERQKKIVAEEYRRQWKNMGYALREGIRKMQFVKVELLTQVKLYAALGGQTLPQKALQQETMRELNDPAKLTFKFDGVMWPDELFQLRSVAQAKCLGRK